MKRVAIKDPFDPQTSPITQALMRQMTAAAWREVLGLDSITGLGGTKAEFNTACSDGDFLFVGDINQAWGQIGGLLSDQIDLQAALDEKLNASKITVGTTAPSSPSVGDIWIDTN